MDAFLCTNMEISMITVMEFHYHSNPYRNFFEVEYLVKSSLFKINLKANILWHHYRKWFFSFGISNGVLTCLYHIFNFNNSVFFDRELSSSGPRNCFVALNFSRVIKKFHYYHHIIRGLRLTFDLKGIWINIKNFCNLQHI